MAHGNYKSLGLHKFIKPRKVHALMISGRKVGDWVICLHCGMAYKIGEYRLMHGDMQMCPYEGCDGDTVMDPIDYQGQGDPVRGKHYNLDGTLAD